MKTLLVALSHPDDEVGCAGTIAAHRAAGHRVVLLWLTRGEMTEALGRLDPEEVGRRRMAHGEAVAKLLDCEPLFMEFPDTRVEATVEAAHRVARAIAEIEPDAVITWGNAWRRGMRHPDHQATGKIVRDAVTLARIARVVEPLPPHRADVPVYTLREPPSLLPEAAVDVSDYREEVLAVARFYRERVGWPDEAWLVGRLEAVGRRWGVAAAESFDAWETEGGLRRLLV